MSGREERERKKYIRFWTSVYICSTIANLPGRTYVMATPNVSELYLACRNGDQQIVERLLPTTSIRVLNRLEPNGSTCLHAASYHGHKDIVRLLLAHGACRRTINLYGCTPLDEAETQEIADLFPRSTEAAQKRFSANPGEEPDWQFVDDGAESYSRCIHWGCLKDRGIKKTIAKIEKANVLTDLTHPSIKLVKDLFQAALDDNNPLCVLQAYTVEGPFYRQLNRYMATGSDSQVFEKLRKKWSGYYIGLIVLNPAFEPYRFSGQTYRGMRIKPEEYARYKRGVALTCKSPQSTSKSWKIAKGFAYPAKPRPETIPVILIFTICDPRSALSVEQISEYPKEEEVLIAPGALFIVTDIDGNAMPFEVHLRQLEWTNEL
jgi:hypothetical protein